VNSAATNPGVNEAVRGEITEDEDHERDDQHRRAVLCRCRSSGPAPGSRTDVEALAHAERLAIIAACDTDVSADLS